MRMTLLFLVCVLGAWGCAQRPLTPTQMDALQVRDVEAPPDRAFGAAVSALIDAGYQVTLTDADAGIVTGEKKENPSVAADVAVVIITAILSQGQGATDIPPTYHTVSIQVLPESGARSNVRIRPFKNGVARACDDGDRNGREKVTELWTLMQRQVLMKEPAR